MNMRKNLLIAGIVGGVGAAASADSFTWMMGQSGVWSNPALWNGPFGEAPNSTLDEALITQAGSEVSMDMNVALGLLEVTAGARVENWNGGSGPFSLFVAGPALMSDSTIVVRDGAPINDFDVDDLDMTNNARLLLEGGTLQIDNSLSLTNSSEIEGSGVVELNSTGPGMTLEDATIEALGPGSTLILRGSGNNTAELDWTDEDTLFRVGVQATMEQRLETTGPLGGELKVFDDATFFSLHPWSTEGVSNVDLHDGAHITGSSVDFGGQVTLKGDTAKISAPAIVFRGPVLTISSWLDLNGPVLLDTSGFTGEGSVSLAGSPSILTVLGEGLSLIANNGFFDLDGEAGNHVVTVQEGSILQVSVETIDVSDNFFDGEMVLDGDLSIDVTADHWTNRTGVITMDSATISGDELTNQGVIQGAGAIDAPFNNDGTLIVEPGTMFIHPVTLLDGESGDGFVDATNGDIVFTGNDSQQIEIFTGTFLLGNGSGLQEVFDMDALFWLVDPGVLSMNGGRVFAQTIWLNGQFTSTGDSTLQTNGPDDANHVALIGSFDVEGSLALESHAFVYESAQFTGAGVLSAAQNRTLSFDNGADTGSVALEAAGTVEVGADVAGLATVHSLALAPSATLEIGVADNVSADRVISGTTIELAGDLLVVPGPEYQPQMGDSFTILSAEQITGSFANVEVAGVGLKASVEVTSTDVFLTISCVADVNEDGAVNILDYVDFQELFQQQDPIADCDQDGKFDVFDFICFQAIATSCN